MRQLDSSTEDEGVGEIERLMSRGRRTDSGCLVWTGALVRGYGHVRSNGKVVKVHRRMYELTRSVSLIPQIKIRHSCDNEPCFEPSHLMEGTQADNVRDRIERGRSSRRGNPKTTPEQRAEMIARVNAGGTFRGIGRDFGISATQVKRIARAS